VSCQEKCVAELGNTKGTSTPKGVPRKFPSKDLKKKIAIVSFIGALGLLLATRLHFFGVPSKDHCAHALPSEEVCSLIAPHFRISVFYFTRIQ